MKFEAGEIAVHVGNKRFAAGTLVRIVEVGPWAAGTHEIYVYGVLLSCKQDADYVIEHVEGTASTRYRAFTVEPHLRKLDDPDAAEKAKLDCRRTVPA